MSSQNQLTLHAVLEDNWCDECGDYALPSQPLTNGVQSAATCVHIKISTLVTFWVEHHQGGDDT